MSTPQKRQRHGGNRGEVKLLSKLHRHGNRPHRPWEGDDLPHNWRERLPDAAGYYGQHVAKLGKPNAAGWAQGRCPFHDDGAESFSVLLSSARGHWRCFAGCGHGDMVAFHERVTGLTFPASARDLLGLRR